MHALLNQCTSFSWSFVQHVDEKLDEQSTLPLIRGIDRSKIAAGGNGQVQSTTGQTVQCICERWELSSSGVQIKPFKQPLRCKIGVGPGHSGGGGGDNGGSDNGGDDDGDDDNGGWL